MPRALFFTSTPLHSLWSLGIGAGMFPDWECSLVSIDQRAEDRDCIADVLSDLKHSPFVEVTRFQQIGKRPQHKILRARAELERVQAYVRSRSPSYIAVGNDRRAEFHAALAAAPSAMGAYMDDGSSSYVHAPPPMAEPWASFAHAASTGVRRLVYGMEIEHPVSIGGSQGAREAWVMLPELVHAALAVKQLRQIESAWFRLPLVQNVCADAIDRAGLDVDRLRETKLLLVIPHDSILRQQPELKRRLEQLANDYVDQGLQVAYKFHPRSGAEKWQLPANSCVEIPRRLPVEILAPLLKGTLVVGSLTAALIFLLKLGSDIKVRTLATNIPEDNPVLQVYRRLGIENLE